MRPWTEMRSLDIADRLTHGPWRNSIYLYSFRSFVVCQCSKLISIIYLYKENLKFFFSFIGWRLQGLHCYRFFEVQHSWERAADSCKRWVPINIIFFFLNLFVYFYFCWGTTSWVLLRASFTTPTNPQSLTLHVEKISRPRFSMQTFVVSVAVVKDSPRLLFFNYFESQVKGIYLSWFYHLNQLTHTFAYFSTFYLSICLPFFWVPNREQCQVNLFISVVGRTEPQQSLKS